MINKEEEEWNKILDNFDKLDIPEAENKQLEPFDLENVYTDFGKYFTDYCKIKYLEDIKESEYYLIKKCERIFYHCVQLDDYFYHLDPDYIVKDKNNKSISFNKSKSKSDSKNILNITPNKSSSELIINTSDIKDEINISKDKNDKIEKNNSGLSEFKLKEAKKSLKIFDCEIATGEEFESKCRRIFNAMLIIIQKDNYVLNHPKKLEIQQFLNTLKLQEFEKEKLTDSDSFEIDIVVNEFKVSDLNKLKINFASHFFYMDKLGDLNENENINIIGEISRNFIFKIRNKYEQLKIYNAVFKIIEFLNNEKCNIPVENKRNILSKFFLKPNKNKNIFLIITDGSYFIFRFVMSTIEKLRSKENDNKKDSEKENESDIDEDKEEENKILTEKEQENNIKMDDQNENQSKIQEENINLNDNNYKYEWDFESDEEKERQKQVENEIKEESVTDNMKESIKDEIKKNKKLLEYLMAHKFRHLTYFIIKTYISLKYLEKNNIRYAILFIGDKGNNRLENFFKEKEEKDKLIKFETNLSFKLRELINKLIENKDLISFEIKKYGNNITELLNNEECLAKTIPYKFKINKLSDYFKIRIKFCYLDDKIKIEEDKNENFVIFQSKKDTSQDFLNSYKKAVTSKNLDALYVFIDKEDKLKIKEDNKFVLLKKDVEFPKIYKEILDYIEAYLIIDFYKIVNIQIKQKIKDFMNKKKEYNSKGVLTLDILKKKLKSYEELNTDIDNLVSNILLLCDKQMIKSEKYVEKLMKYKDLFETWMKEKFAQDFEKIIKNNFVLLAENIKSSIIYDFVIQKIFPELIIKSWSKIYNSNNN